MQSEIMAPCEFPASTRTHTHVYNAYTHNRKHAHTVSKAHTLRTYMHVHVYNAYIQRAPMHVCIPRPSKTFMMCLGASTLAFQLHFIHTIIETKSTSVPTVVFESTLDCNVSTYCYYACDDLASNEGRSVSQKCLVAVTCSEN